MSEIKSRTAQKMLTEDDTYFTISSSRDKRKLMKGENKIG